MKLKPLKVSEVNEYIKRILISDPILYNLNVEGEISNFKHHYNGHMYFSLKDNKSRLKCVMFNNNNMNLKFELEDGMKVIVSGYISVYEKDGSYQLYAKDIITNGLGDLHVAFEQLKKKLEKEGLFDQKYKKRLPFMPKKIGVVTSSTGAAIRDIITIIKRRFSPVDILIYPVLVQGDRAHKDICEGLSYFNSRDDIDLVITGRGGGSIEELWAFNEEDVARTIFNMKIPVISAVGHETDFTIADFVSDLRAPTPSAAGELATPILDELKDKLQDYFIRLQMSYKNYIKDKRIKLEINKTNLNAYSPIYKLNENRNKLQILLKDLISAVNINNDNSRKKLEILGGKLNALSPLSTLDRGFSIAMDNDNNILKSVDNINNNDIINVVLSDGTIISKVIKTEKK